MARRRQPEPLSRWSGHTSAGDWLVTLTSALLPWLGTGLILDELPAVGAYAGRAVLLALLLLALILLRGRPGRVNWAGGPLLALLLLGVVGLLLPRGGPTRPIPVPGGEETSLQLRFPADPGAGLDELARLALVLVATVVAARARPEAIFAGLALGAAGVGVRGLQEYLPQLRAGNAAWRVFAGFGNPNQAATWLIIVLPVVVAGAGVVPEGRTARWLTRQGVAAAGLKLRLGLAVTALGTLVVLGLTQSRGGLAGLGLGLLAGAAGLVAGGRRRAGLGLLVVLLLGAAVMLAGPLRPRLAELAHQTHSAGFRSLTWRGTLDLAEAAPLLGVGLGGWATSYPAFARASYTHHAHNGYLQVLAETGAPGLLAYLLLLAVWLGGAWRAVRSGDPRRAVLGVGAVTGLVAFLVHNAVDYGWYVTAAPLALALVTGALEGAPARAGSVRLAVGAGALALLVTLAGVAAEAHRARALTALERGLAPTAVEAARRAVASAPWSAVALESLATAETARGRPEQAAETYRRALRQRPNHARLEYRLAVALEAAGEPAAAIAAARRAVALSPLHLQGYLLCGRLLETTHPDEAIAVYRRLDELARSPALVEADPLREYLFEPTHGYGLMRLAALLQAADDRSGAADACRRARPVFARYLTTYADAERQMGDLPADRRRELLAQRGLRAEEKAAVERLDAEARVLLDELGAALEPNE